MAAGNIDPQPLEHIVDSVIHTTMATVIIFIPSGLSRGLQSSGHELVST